MTDNTSTEDPFEGIFVQNGRNEYEFEEMDTPIGRGAFGIVFKSMNKIDDKYYAIKKIKIKDNKDFQTKIKEIKVWAKLDCDYFVQYRSSWVEIYDQKSIQTSKDSLKILIQMMRGSVDETDDNPKHAILHIQMDLCSMTLRDAMEKVNKEMNIKPKELLNPIGYYIASELLIEILQSIQFLHKQIPAIIHRDLKPHKILVTNGANGRYIKIGDFGLATTHSEEQSHTQLDGSLKYMAPEVMNSRKYDTKADIYSLGVITQEMFNIDINKNDFKSDDQLLSDKYNNIINLINESMSVVRNMRPNCDQMLANRDKWAYGFNDISTYIENNVIDISKENNFTFDFLRSKFRIHSKV